MLLICWKQNIKNNELISLLGNLGYNGITFLFSCYEKIFFYINMMVKNYKSETNIDVNTFKLIKVNVYYTLRISITNSKNELYTLF